MAHMENNVPNVEQPSSSIGTPVDKMSMRERVKQVHLLLPITCPITLEEVEHVCNELPCGHQFSDAIHEWLTVQTTCPLFRSTIVPVSAIFEEISSLNGMEILTMLHRFMRQNHENELRIREIENERRRQIRREEGIIRIIELLNQHR